MNEENQTEEQQPIQPTTSYKLGEWFPRAWAMFKTRPMELIALQFTMIAAMIPMMLIIMPFLFLVVLPNEHPSGFQLVPSIWMLEYYGVALIASAVFISPFAVGMSAVMLNFVRTGQFDWNRIWTGYRNWGSCFLAGLFPGVIMSLPGLSVVLYILFPIWLIAGFWMILTYYSLAETGMTYSQALIHALRLVGINFWWAMLFYFITMVVSAAGIVACCIGIFATAAFSQLLIAIAYNDLAKSLPATEADEPRF